METTINKTLTGKQMEVLFDNPELVNIRYFKNLQYTTEEDYNEKENYRFQIKIRHNENEDPKNLLNNAYKKLFNNTMKTIKTTIATLLLTGATMFAQTVTTKVPGINTTVRVNANDIKEVFNLDIKKPKTKEQQIGKATLTNDVAIYKTIQYPVYMTEKGKMFIVFENKEKTGYSKKYIPTNS